MESIKSFEQLTTKLQEAEQVQSISDDLFRQSLSSWKLSPALFGEIPKNPFSPEFKTFQLEIYKRLTNQEYNVSNEETIFNFDHEIQWPYPYGTKSAQTVGTSLMGYGWLITKINLPPESRILEIGSGYGSLTTHLAQMGYQVTCLDISSSLLEFIKARTAHFPQPIKTICGDMATVEIEGTFDAVIFNASLHHSLEHRDVIKRLDKLLTENGIMAFVTEPIFPAFSKYVPYPWGIRLDGMSIWAISRWGWLELGFQKSYFTQMLKDIGWHTKHYNLGVSSTTDVWLATKTKKINASSTILSTIDKNSTVDLGSQLLRFRYLIQGSGQNQFTQLMKRLKLRK